MRPSNADYKITQDLVVEQVSGDPLQLKNLTLFQDATGARGSVTNVEQIQYDQGQYYQVSIDFGYQRDIDVSGSIFSEFEPNSQTKILTTVSAGSSIIDVDSTVGFAATGYLVANDVDNNAISITYLDKNDNQFLNVSGVTTSLVKTTDIRFNDYSYAYAGINTSDQIRVRITSTLKELNLNEKTYLYKKDDTINVQSLGLETNSEKTKNWLPNIKTKWNIESVSLVDANENSYQFRTYDPHFLREGYSVLASDLTVDSSVTGNVSAIRSSRSFIVKLSSAINTSHTFVVENQLLKGNSANYPQFNKYVANVQNTYSDFDDNVIVASNSIPRYSVQTNPYDKKVTISGTYQSTQTLTLTTSSDGLVAKLSLATLLPFTICLTSGSAPKRPIKSTLFKLPAIIF